MGNKRSKYYFNEDEEEMFDEEFDDFDSLTNADNEFLLSELDGNNIEKEY